MMHYNCSFERVLKSTFWGYFSHLAFSWKKWMENETMFLIPTPRSPIRPMLTTNNRSHNNLVFRKKNMVKEVFLVCMVLLVKGIESEIQDKGTDWTGEGTDVEARKPTGRSNFFDGLKRCNPLLFKLKWQDFHLLMNVAWQIWFKKWYFSN